MRRAKKKIMYRGDAEKVISLGRCSSVGDDVDGGVKKFGISVISQFDA